MINTLVKLSICGINELHNFENQNVTHVISLLDPGMPDPEAFKAFGTHIRTTHRFHDIIDYEASLVLPSLKDVVTTLAFADKYLTNPSETHLLIHCHSGISRSPAILVAILALTNPSACEDELFLHLRMLRPKAWPNSLIIRHADQILNRNGRLIDVLGRHYAYQINTQPALPRLMKRTGRIWELNLGKIHYLT